MAKNPLFSTYRQGENRVTSSMLAVFERIDLSVLEELLAAASGESSLRMVTFTNQPPGRGASVPDGRISARFAYWFEVKTTRNAVRTAQLKEHLASLDVAGVEQRLFVVTPDPVQPPAVSDLGDSRIVWFSFAALHDAIDSALADPVGVISEQARFLLRELQALLVEDGLLDGNEVVVAAARVAYPEDLKYAAYVCQPGRAFRDGLTHLGFYSDGCIQRELPAITYREDDVPFTTEEAARRRERDKGHDQRMAEIIDELLAGTPRQHGETFQVFLLTPPGHPDTVMLPNVIVNEKTAASGRPFAWTLGRRYVSLGRLTAPDVTLTSDLERPA